MQRKIVAINESLCNGCSLCVSACHEGAIQLVDGKARLVSESYCDGLGDCLPACPTGAITIEVRESANYDEEAVKQHLSRHEKPQTHSPACDCTGTIARTLPKNANTMTPMVENINFQPTPAPAAITSQLRQWPIQIKLVPVNAPFFHKANLLIAATCAGFSYANLHEDFIKGKIVLIGCPKLDMVNYAEKLTAIFAANEINSVTVLRMEVPCCGGLTQAVKHAFTASGVIIPWQVITLSTEGKIIPS